MNIDGEKLDLATEKGSTEWLRKFIRQYLAMLVEGGMTPTEFAAELDEEFASRMLDTPKKQKNYRSNVVQALKVFDERHPAIELVALSTEQYQRLNDQQKARVAQRETQYLAPDAVEALVSKADALLDSEDWADVGAGLSVLMGRRISEVLLSEFERLSPWSIRFAQMAKKADQDQVAIEIPTLVPADRVMAAIERLQGTLELEEGVRQLSSRQAKLRVNQKFSGPIARKCVQHFSELVSPRTDRDNLYTHLFRAVYATIAAHWFCPPSVPEHLFKAEIQGHFTLSQDGEKLPNYAARSNYDDYAVGDGNGNRDGRLGVKLGRLPGLKVIQAFHTEHTEEQKGGMTAMARTVDEPRQQQGQGVEPVVDQTVLAKLHSLMELKGLKSSGDAAEDLRRFLEAVEQEATQTPNEVAQVAPVFNWFTHQIDLKDQEIQTLRQGAAAGGGPSLAPEDEEEWAELERQNSELRGQNSELVDRLRQTQTQLQGIQSLLGIEPNAAAHPSPSPSVPNDASVGRHQSTSPSVPNDASVGRHQSTVGPEGDERINDILDAIINWNEAQPNNDQRIRVSFAALRSLAVLLGANSQPAMKVAIDARKTEIDEMHQRYMLGSRHNRGIKDKDSVLRAIARDYLKLSNWMEASYS